MLSKILPWDFVTKFPKTLDSKILGLQTFLIDDPYLGRVFLDRLPRKEMSFSLYSGNEISRDFIEEHFVNLSLFGNTDHIIVINAENIPSSSVSFLLEQDIDWESRCLLLFFSKSSKQFSELAKNKKVHGVEIELPRFWEGPKMWQFCQKVREVHFDGVISRFALENLEHNFESFFWLIDTVSLHFPDGRATLAQLQELVSRERFDFFELIDLFHKKPSFFFQEVLKKEVDYDWLRGLFAFMQTHLLKILFPQEIHAKSKLSKYDQSILDMSERLDRHLMKVYMDLFSELEILAKSRDEFLVNRMRLEVLSVQK